MFVGCAPVSSTPQTLNSSLLVTLALKCQSTATKGNTHPEALKLHTVPLHMSQKNDLYSLEKWGNKYTITAS